MSIIKRAYNQTMLIFDQNRQILKWSRTDLTEKNIGDALNPILFEKIFKKQAVNLGQTLNYGIFPVYAFIGSILDNNRVKNLYVMGAGFKSETSGMPVKPVKIYSVRGPLSRERFLSMGLKCPEVYGDPAILLPKYYDPAVKKTLKMGIIPHYVDKKNPSIYTLKKLQGAKEIDVFSNYKEFVRDIKSCDFTVSTSLHGIILSHAYGIPSVWIKVSDEILGGNYKFYDYYASVNLKDEPFTWDGEVSISELEEKKKLPEIEVISKLQENLLHNLNHITI